MVAHRVKIKLIHLLTIQIQSIESRWKKLDSKMFVQPEQFSEHLRIGFTRKLSAIGSLITIPNYLFLSQ